MNADEKVLGALCSAWVPTWVVAEATGMSPQLARHHLNKLRRYGKADKRVVAEGRSGRVCEWRLGDGREEQA